MQRRHWLGLAGLACASRPGWTQPAERVFRLGILRPSAPPLVANDLQITGLPRALAELGYVEGRNLLIEQRWAGGDTARLPALALELQRSRVELVVAVGAQSILAVRQATPTLPIVMFGNFDPVALGLMHSLARPGGNITGVLIAPDGTLAGKRLELLKAAVPQATKMAYLAPPADAATRLQLQETRRAASMLGVELADVEVRDGDYARAFAAIALPRPGALVVGAHTFFVRDRMQIIALAAQHKLPAIYEWREQVMDGGLMAYSTSLYGLYQRLAWYVDRIRKGAKPGELPVERPSKFELAINLKTAKALGLSIPQSLLLRADEVIE
jgi:putative ABC transport system substrate-binding protein